MGSKFEFDSWKSWYSDRTISMKSSEVRDLLSVSERPDVISFAGGLPDTRVLPLDRIRDAAVRVIEVDGPAALQYGTSEGLWALREQTALITASEGVKKPEPEDILLTNGSQQALELLGKVLLNPGDSIIVEAPSYVGALNAFSSYQADFISIDMDDDGMRVDLLEKKLVELTAQKKRIKFIYLVPTFQNPAGVTLSEERRKIVVELAEKYDLLVIEDNPYSHLRFEGLPLKPLLSLSSDRIIYLGTFSKILSPGFRVGWLYAPKAIYEKLIFAKQAADLCSSTFAQKVLCEYLDKNKWDAVLPTLINIYRRRRDVMLEALGDFFPEECSWTRPKGGLFLWVTLPEYIDSTEMLAESISEAKVAYVPGRAFFTGGAGGNYMRFNFSFPDEEGIYEGVKRLAKVVKKQMELYRYLQP